MWRIYTPTIWSLLIWSSILFYFLYNITTQSIYGNEEEISFGACILYIFISLFGGISLSHLVGLMVLNFWSRMNGYRVLSIKWNFKPYDLRIMWRSRFVYEIRHDGGKYLVCLNRGKFMSAIRRIK